MTNGIITVYEIRCSNRSGTFNTTDTQYTIQGLTAGTSYVIEVRAYTSIGPGEWTSIVASTAIPIVSGFSITRLNSTTVMLTWEPIDIKGVNYYTVYYTSISECIHVKNITYSSDVSKGVIGALIPDMFYVFKISVTFNINSVLYEGETTPFTPPECSPTVTYSNPTCMSNSTSILLPISGSLTGALLLVVILLVIVVIIETSLLIYCKTHYSKKQRPCANQDVPDLQEDANQPDHVFNRGYTSLRQNVVGPNEGGQN
jgi:hypothetical protein